MHRHTDLTERRNCPTFNCPKFNNETRSRTKDRRNLVNYHVTAVLYGEKLVQPFTILWYRPLKLVWGLGSTEGGPS